MVIALIAALWGFAEATLFFVVPDVYLTLVAVRDTRAALRGCVFAVAGALLGGAVMYLWGALNASAATATLDAVPAVSVALIEQVRAQLSELGLVAVFLGPFFGTPYKIYAVLSGGLGLGLAGFLLVSVPARAIRFVLLSVAAGWLSRKPLGAWPLHRKQLVGAVLWMAFYAVYLTLMWD